MQGPGRLVPITRQRQPCNHSPQECELARLAFEYRIRVIRGGNVSQVGPRGQVWIGTEAIMFFPCHNCRMLIPWGKDRSLAITALHVLQAIHELDHQQELPYAQPSKE